MKRFGGRLAAALVLALLPATAGTALAAYDGAWATVQVWHGPDLVATYDGTGSCSGATCDVSVVMSNRDFGRFQRWCGGSASFAVPAGYAFGNMDCQGSSTWSIHVQAGLTSGGLQTTDYSEPTVTVTGQ